MRQSCLISARIDRLAERHGFFDGCIELQESIGLERSRLLRVALLRVDGRNALGLPEGSLRSSLHTDPVKDH